MKQILLFLAMALLAFFASIWFLKSNKHSAMVDLKINRFEVIHYGHFGRYRTLGMIFYIIFVLRIKMPIFFKLLEFFKLDKVITYLNLYDEMIVIAKKII